MEAIRVRATQSAANAKARNLQRLIHTLGACPATLTTDELRAMVTNSNYKGTFHSMTNKLRRHRLMTYDAAAGVWVNHCIPSGNNPRLDATSGG